MIFGKQKKSKQLSLVHIVNALQKEKIGDNDFLEEIKLDLQEDIPLSQKKIEYLKEEIHKLKEIKAQTKSKTNLPKDVESKKNIKPKKEKPPKKLRFGNILKINKKTSEKIEPQLSKQNPDVDKLDNKRNFLPSAVKSSPPKQLTKQDSKIAPKIDGKQKRTGFFKFLSIRKKPHKGDEKPTQNQTQNLSSKELDKNANNIADSKDAAGLIESNKTETIAQMNHELSDLHCSQEPEMNVGQTLDVNTKPLNEEATYRFEKSQSGIKHVIDDINKEKELLKTDIEEAKQLDDIKQLLEELSKEKEQLKTNVEDMKRRFSVKPLVKKYDDIEQRLQSATDVLYSIQSDIYERIKELKFLRKDLSVIKEDLNSL